MSTLSIDTHIDALDAAGTALVEAAAAAGPDAEVTTCADWQVRDLLRHMTKVHRWAAATVAGGLTSPHRPGEDTELDGDDLVAYVREGHAHLVDVLRKAPADLECWTFAPAPSPLAFWARRQAHETIVHRADAASALGPLRAPDLVTPELATDGIDELLSVFHSRDRSRVRVDQPRTLRVRTTDTGGVRTVRLSEQAPRIEASADGPADCEMSGPADRLYLMLWNRLPQEAVTVSGDASLARLWRDKSAL
ncbi:maleylpyruvate isomerase family mycothiol-dependent enzyme [Streptomyces sp. NPDC048717]|uniref:maleylpyruvate isomerase family mycothiol-dependent enzyme n=1 Tax=Streptomyces sp. NPDC048717 TaxID=3154928 RepID=UPI0034232EF6